MIIKHLLRQILKDKYLIILLVVFSLFNIYFLCHAYGERNTIEQPEIKFYQDYSGKLDNKKIKEVIEKRKELGDIIKSGNYSNEYKKELGYTGYIKGDFNLYTALYDNYKYIYNYRDYAKSRSKQYPQFEDRSLDSYYDYEDESILLHYDIYTFLCLIIAIFIGCKSIERERESRMFINISLSERGLKNIIAYKFLSNSIIIIAISIFFALMNFIVASINGNLDGIYQPLYAIEEYKNCLYSGNILSLYIVGTLAVSLVALIFGQLAMILSLIIKNIIYALVLNIAIFIISIVAYISIDFKYNLVSLLSFSNSISDSLIFKENLIFFAIIAGILGIIIVFIGDLIDLSKEN